MKTKYLFIYCLLFIAYCRLSLQAQTWDTVSERLIGYVFTLKKIDTLLYVGGGFTYVGNMKMNGIATWDGVKWDSLNSAITGGVFDICKYNNEIYIGGAFGIPSVPNGCFAKWDGISWSAVGLGLSDANDVSALIVKNKLYLGGGINQIGNLYPHNIASWDGSNYDGLNSGVVGPFEHVYALVDYNNELIAGGIFNYAGGNVAFNIAAWNGGNWHALDTGTDEIVEALVVDTINNFLYVGGGFISAGGIDGVNSKLVTRWDGFQWDNLMNTSLPFCDCLALCMYRNKLFAGFCSTTGTITDTLLAKWDGEKWTRIEGPNQGIRTLCEYQDELYVGGYFSIINQDSVFSIARYYEPPDTTCDYLQAIIQPKNAVLNISDSTTVCFYNNIINGSSWQWDFGDGATDTVRMPVHTYAGGGVFNVMVIVTYQNCTDTAYTTVTIVDDVGIKDNKNDSTEYLGQNIPNPFDNTTTIPYYVPSGSKGFLQIYDAKGEMLDEYALQQGKNKLDVSLEYLKAGVYFYSIVIDGKIMQTKKMILE